MRRIAAASVALPTLAFYASLGSTSFLTRPIYYAAVITSWTLCFWAWATYRIILRPKFLSSLRSLPEPTGRSWWNGFASREFHGMKGGHIAKWYCRQHTLRHDGMFRYLGILNSERIAVTTKEGVAELARRYQYDFPKTKMLEKLAEPIIGRGLVIVNGDEHKRQRRLLTPVFAMKHMRDLEPTFWAKSVEVSDKFDEIVEKTAAASGFSAPIDIDFYTGLVGLDIISKAALGTDYRSIQDPNSELVANYRECFEPTTLFRFIAILRLVVPDMFIKALPLKRVQSGLKAIALLHSSFHREIRTKKSLMKQGKLTSNDIISLLIRDRHCEDEDELVIHMLTMLGAGHETVAVSITWAMYEFARRPEWQRSVRREIRSRLPSPRSGGAPQYSDLEHESMPLLNAFVSEILRYWPAIPLTSRTAAHDTTLQGVFVGETTKVCVSIVGFNRDPANWGPTARTFDPSRWLTHDEATGRDTFDSTGGALHKTAFQTFFHGQRACIGRTFARHEMLNVLSCWIGRMDFVLTDVTQMDENNIEISGGGITSRPLQPIYVNARRVEGW
ncbi:hypothetical protein DOTSEDRAFT_136392 [Dothistroma septosporum NZE10]|uniref:Cytochrome P450 n=1 Tax=Dothistroma septosporum (strain NZE10 / CBS 128990) TaxID=675120 RepID=N1PEK2_DOTSN|nr:hypothetical protein DOTSEDRAFT_136392 [Dothistroma septosporum NZE10]